MSREEKQQSQQAELQKQLWSIANTLRGNMDANDFKNYILGLIFYRYLSENLVNYVNSTYLKDDEIDYEEAWNKEEYREALKSVLLELKIQKLGRLDLDTVAEISKDIESDTKTTRQFIEETRSDFLQEPDNKKKTF